MVDRPQTYQQLKSADPGARFVFSQADLSKVEADIRTQLAGRGITLDAASNLFPVSDNAPSGALKHHAVGATEDFVRRNTACLDGTDSGGFVPVGSDPTVAKYMDLSRLFFGVHETGHVVDGALNTDKQPRGLVPPLDLKKRSENVADVTAAIYMLNKYPDNPRVKEFLPLFALARRANAFQSRGDHDSSLLMNKLLEDPANWRLDGGKNADIVAAAKKAISFVEGNPSLAMQKNPLGVDAARDRLCLTSRP